MAQCFLTPLVFYAQPSSVDLAATKTPLTQYRSNHEPRPHQEDPHQHDCHGDLSGLHPTGHYLPAAQVHLIGVAYDVSTGRCSFSLPVMAV
ncbi:MAG: hypothetical protein QOI89_3470 [Solirubrobacteraceae bacterium]|jgi:hypothetical protein|nr:hypothetical protein [Solirubrobacteraceae bacterium]